MKPGPKTQSPWVRFWRFVDPQPGECWEWKGGKTRGNYGAFEDGQECRAHRVSWHMHNGPVPEGMHVLHRCDNPPCVNPEHLFLGTRSDNMRDAVAKGRFRGDQPSGEKHPRARLTWDQVREMRALYAEGWTQKALSEKYGVVYTQVGNIVRGESWKEVQVV